MSQFWPDGLAIDVDRDAAAVPLMITWNGERHPVAHVAARWRVDVGWWRWRTWREYFTLATRTGLLVTVFRDLLRPDAWYLQRLYD